MKRRNFNHVNLLNEIRRTSLRLPQLYEDGRGNISTLWILELYKKKIKACDFQFLATNDWLTTTLHFLEQTNAYKEMKSTAITLGMVIIIAETHTAIVEVLQRFVQAEWSKYVFMPISHKTRNIITDTQVKLLLTKKLNQLALSAF